jgi:putative hydrolase of the HAD superfamily
MRRPKVICFDMGYTLLMHRPTGPDLYRRVLVDSGIDVSLETLEAALAPAREHYIRSTREGRDFEASMDQATAFWTEYNGIILKALGVPEERHREVGEKIYTTAWQPENWELFPDSVAALEALRAAGIRMVVISNFVDTLRAVCELHQVAGFFEDIIASVEAGAMKPDPRIFRLALRRLGVDAADAWHVGDNYWADVLGSRAVGMTPVLVDRERAVPNPDCLTVHSLHELVEMVRATEDSEAAA